MLPSRIRAGASFTAYTDFKDEYGKPIPPLSPVTYSIRDDQGGLILEGTAQQSSQPERWQTNISIPEQVFPGTFTFTWTLKGSEGREIQRETFEIADQSPNYYELDQLVPEKSVLTDALKVGRDEDVSDCFVTLVRPDGTEIYTQSVDVSNAQIYNGKKYITFRSNGPVEGLVAGADITAMYILVWDFRLDGEQQKIYSFMYVANYSVIAYIRELKRMIDKAGIQHPNPNLRYNDVDLVAYLNLGLQWLNAQPPTQTAWTINSIPGNMYAYVLNAAAYEAISSRLNAEGEAAFNFNGQPITLEVDRTGFLEAALGRYADRLQNFNTVKKGAVMAGGGVGSTGGAGGAGGVLGYSIGPTLNLNPYGFNSRSPFYQNWVSANQGYTDPIL